eukprot:TRINITY_DN27540_c0_g1_i1.p1 TRINITY_DN27540_c0_g1~~TRINITY_DN27540_c0_g1_i1.p1  ORF type:complete len:442 (+),score=49.82 TRINITY_DN27540_c0_g1_i1:87-1412(+)
MTMQSCLWHSTSLFFCALLRTACLGKEVFRHEDSSVTSSLCIGFAEHNRTAVIVRYADGFETAFHHIWLRDNAADVFDNSSGQRIRNVSQLSLNLQPLEIGLHGEHATACRDLLEVKWRDNSSSFFAASMLRKNAYDLSSQHARNNAVRPRTFRLAGQTGYPSVNFSEVMESEEGLHAWLQNLDRHGWCLINHIPNESAAVVKLAHRIGPVSHASLYGEYWHVISDPDPKNIAYSNQKIPPHMDLPYYESPPGIQFLHARTFEAEGGDSVLIDAHALAEELRTRDSVAFERLSRIPATFTKQRATSNDKQHAMAASMEYRRPHIDVSDMGEVKAVFWSPPFMGPLRCRPDDVIPYYEAVQAFEKLIEDDPAGLKIEFRLKEGSAVTFNQRRMLHGRHEFKGGRRHLEGTYVNIDDFKSAIQLLNSRTSRNTSPWRCGNGAF